MDAKNTPIDVDEIEMEKTDLSSSRSRLVIAVPSRLAKRFKKKMIRSGEDTSGQKARNALTRFSINAALKRFDITPVVNPVPSPNSVEPVISEKADFLISVDVDVFPDIDFPDFASLEFFMPEKEVTEEMIYEELENQRYMIGKRVVNEEGASNDDEILIDMHVTINDDSAPFFIMEDFSFIIKSAQEIPLGPFSFSELASSMIGKRVGQNCSIECTVPAGIHEDVTGRSAIAKFMIKGISSVENVSPEEIAEAYGSASVDMLKQQIEMALEDRVQLNQEAVLRDQVFAKLTELTDFYVSEFAIDACRKNIQRSKISLLKKRGFEEDAIKEKLLADEQHDRELARNEAKANILLTALSKKFDIVYEENDLMEYIARKAAELGKRPAEFREEIVQANRMPQVVDAVVSSRCVEHIAILGTVATIPLEEWNEKQAIE